MRADDEHLAWELFSRQPIKDVLGASSTQDSQKYFNVLEGKLSLKPMVS